MTSPPLSWPLETAKGSTIAAIFQDLMLRCALTAGTVLGLAFYPTAYLCSALFVFPAVTVFSVGLALQGRTEGVRRSVRVGLRAGCAVLAGLAVIAMAGLTGCLLVAICSGMSLDVRRTAKRVRADVGQRFADEFDLS